jgi:hypothetical protein
VIPRPWAVERTLAWLTAHRRLARDHERHPATSEAMIRWAAINTITRRIARGGPATRHNDAYSNPSVDLLKHVLSLDPWMNCAGDRRVNEGSAPLSWDDRCS